MNLSDRTKHLATLNEQITLIADRVRGVAHKHSNGFYLCGRAGTSKTFTVRRILDAANFTYYYQTGHLTPVGLYDILEANAESIIVLDDVSAIFQQPVALQILLAALGTQSNKTTERLICYNRHGEDNHVAFTGGIIAISNLDMRSTPVLDALKSRVHCYNYDPSDDEIEAVMWDIADKGWKREGQSMSPDECKKVMSVLVNHSRERKLRLDIRMLCDKAFPDYCQHRAKNAVTDWQQLIAVTVSEAKREADKPTKQKVVSRKDMKRNEYAIIHEIHTKHKTMAARLEAWRKATGKEQAAYYRRLKDIK